MAYATPQDAVYQRLKADGAVNTATGGRINPQFGTQEPVFPLVRFSLAGADQVNVLSGQRSGRVQGFTVDIESIATSEATATDVGKKVAAALCPDGGWSDRANGLHGVFPGDVSQTTTEDAFRVYSQSFRVYFQPAG